MIRLYTLYTPEAELHAWSDGAIALYRRTATGPSLVVRGKASVPWFLARQECTCDESVPGRCASLSVHVGLLALLALPTGRD